MSILVTGAAGFIGANFIHQIINQVDEQIIALDALTYAGNRENIIGLESRKMIFEHKNICNKSDLEFVFSKYKISKVVHFAAESHVDRSIMSSDPFVQTNVVGTQLLLDVSKHASIERFVHVSTDEVYGSLGLNDPAFTESHQIQPNSPYSASKASSDLLVRSYYETFGFPAMITRCSNNYGPYQFPEKLIPLMIHHANSGKSLPVYGNGKNVRDWIYVTDHCDAVLSVLNHGTAGEVYNIGGESELNNLTIVKKIIEAFGISESRIEFVKDRPGHDFRYAMNINKIKTELNWQPKISFEAGLEKTIKWYKSNQSWLDRVVSGEYKTYIKEQYQ
ncbi:MAG: dTDP-glucose 4,6-dehydratase [Candidatus Margulisiibacteriota bacterium]